MLCPHCNKELDTVGIQQTAYARVHLDTDGNAFDWDNVELTEEYPTEALCGNCGKNVLAHINLNP